MNDYNTVDMVHEINNVINDINSNWQDLDVNDVEARDIWRDSISRTYISKLREIDDIIKSINYNLNNLKTYWNKYNDLSQSKRVDNNE